MSKKPTLLGKPAALGIAIIAGFIFVHGIFSSVLLSLSNCSQVSRIADIIILLVALLCVLIPSIWKNRSDVTNRLRNPVIRVVAHLLVVFTAWIVVRGLMTHTGVKEILLSVLLDTVLFWVFLLCSVCFPARKDPGTTIAYIVAAISGISVVALGIYLLKQNAHLDSLLGYGQCGTESALRTAGDAGWLRSRGFARNPNELGALLIVPFTVSVGWLTQKKLQTRTRIVAGACVTVLASLILLTFSRSALIAAAVAALSLVIIDSPTRAWVLAKRWWLAGLVAVCAITVLATTGPSRIVNELLLHKSSTSDSTAKHVSSKLDGLRFTYNHPFGAGPGSAGAVGAALKDGPSIETESAYIDIAAQYGWFGLAFYIGLLIAIVAAITRSTNRYATHVRAGVLGLIIGGIVIPVWSNLPVTILVGILVGLASLSTKSSRRSGPDL